MENNPLVTIICLCYNHAKFVEESLNSILKQNYSHYEIIILDDFSSDDSVNIIENWLKIKPDAIFIKNKTNLGNTKSFNKALEFANGEFIIDLASDDILLPYCITLQIEKFTNSKFNNLAVVYGNASLISEDGISISNYFPVDESKKTIQKISTGNIYQSILSGETVLCSVSSLYKTSILKSLNGYDENLAYEDLDIWIRIARNYSFDYIDAILVKKRIVSNSLGNNFHDKNFKKSNPINYSTYIIIEKAFRLNKTKEENKAILKRVHYDIILNLKNKNYKLFIRFIILELKIRLKIFLMD